MGLCNSKPPTASGGSGRREEVVVKKAEEEGGVSVKENGVDLKEKVEGGNPKKSDKKESDPEAGKKSPFFPFYSPSPAHYLFGKKTPGRSSPANGSATATPKRGFRLPFPPPSPAKHIKSVLARRHGVKTSEASIPEGSEVEGGAGLVKSFGFSKNFGNKYELGDEVGRGHFGYTCVARFKKGELKGQQVAVKVIPKAKV